MKKRLRARSILLCIAVFSAVVTLACGDGQDTRSVDSLLQLLPRNTDSVTFADMEGIRDEWLDGLESQIADLVDADRLEEWDVDLDDIDSLIVSDPDSSDALTVLRGVFSMNDVEDALEDEGFRDASYKDVTVWSERRGAVALALIGDDVIVMGEEQRVEEALDVFLDDARSMAQDEEAATIVDALEDAVLYSLSDDCSYRGCGRSASGARVERRDLVVLLVYAFRDADAASDAERDVEDDLDELADDPDVRVDGALVVAVSAAEEDELRLERDGALALRTEEESAPVATRASQQAVASPTPAPISAPVPLPNRTPTPTPKPTLVPTPTPESTAVAAPATVPTQAPAREIPVTVVPTQAPAAAPVPTATTFRRLWSDPITLDPHRASDVTSAGVIVEVFSGLVTLNADLQIEPDIAEAWEVSNDGRVYTFIIRSNARFHDGSPIKAHDLVYSFNRAASPATDSSTAETYLGDIVGVRDVIEGGTTDISGVEAIDDFTLEITIDAPKSYFLAKLTHPTAFVVDRKNVESDPNWTSSPNGSGPFRLKEYSLGQRIVLERNENFYLQPAKLDQVILNLAGGDRLLMYQNDELDIAELGWSDMERLRDSNKPLREELVVAPPPFWLSYIGLNPNKPPLDDLDLRKALNMAIDKERIAEVLPEGGQVPAYGVLPPGFPGHNPDLEGLRFDPDLGRRLLRQSKYADSATRPPIVVAVADSGGAMGLVLEVILEMWQNYLDIEVEVLFVNWATFLNGLRSQEYHAFQFGWVADYVDPQNFLDILFHSDSRQNLGGYSNPNVDAILEQARVENNVARRIAFYQSAEEMIVADAALVPLWFSGERYVLIKPHVKGYVPTPIIVPQLRYVYVEDD